MLKSTQQKLNMKSLKEAELIAVDDAMPQVIWTINFLEAQGYKVTDNVRFQDNESPLLLEKNWKWSSSKQTRHINIRNFFVTNQIRAGEMIVSTVPQARCWRTTLRNHCRCHNSKIES